MENQTRTRGILPVLTILVLIALPLFGVILAGKELTNYLKFPPLTRYVEHQGFSWFVFLSLAICVVVVVTPFLLKVISSPPIQKINQQQHPFPLWGWFAIFLCLFFWLMAWSRFEWFAQLQLYTIFPLWLGYIGIVNAFTYKRSGKCMLTHQRSYLMKLFILSTLFWWYFEYLNRFVQNWHYLEVAGLSPGQYVIFASLPFSTVLPAVMGTCELLRTFPRLSAGLESFIKFNTGSPRLLAGVMLALAAVGLLGIGIKPHYLYPLIWLSPLFILTSLQTLTERTTIFASLRQGNWQRIFLLAISALLCGFFWEMWNFYSYAKWQYSIPFVQRFHIFEMPLLGYAGYLPFGLECGVVAEFARPKKE